MFLRMFRFFARIFGLMKPGIGKHCCWRCALYDPTKRVCTVIVNRHKKDPRTEEVILEQIKMDPGEFCIWRHIPPAHIDMFDFQKTPDIPDEDEPIQPIQSTAPPSGPKDPS